MALQESNPPADPDDDDRKKIAELQAQLASVKESQDRQERDLIAQEHRLFHAIANAWVHWGGSSEKYRAALGALGWCLTARALRTTAFAAAGGTAFLAAFFAWQANVLIDEQNQRIDLQTHLMESQRRAGLIFEISSILDQVEIEKQTFFKSNSVDEPAQTGSWDAPTDLAAMGSVVDKTQKTFSQSEALSGRIAALSLSLRPYYYLSYQKHYDLPSFKIESPTILGSIYDAVFELSLRRSASSTLPYLNARPLSPERGQLLLTLSSSGIDFAAVTARGATFADADLSDRLITGDFHAVELTGANFRRSKFYMASFKSGGQSPPRLDRADFTCASFLYTTMINATLDDASFAFVKMRDLQLSLRGRFGSGDPQVDTLHLSRADLTDADFTDALVDDPTWLVNSDGTSPKGFDKTRWQFEPTGTGQFIVKDSFTGVSLEAWQKRAADACAT